MSSWSPPSHSSSYPAPPPVTTSSSILALQARPKAKKRRRRETPVGPAGVWFEAQKLGQSVGLHQALHNAATQAEDEPPLVSHNTANVTSNPAWMAMECDLQRLTPNVQLPTLTVAQRYKRIRPHLNPQEDLLLPDLETRWKMPKGARLIVLVHSIACDHDNDLWQVELQDDTGSTVQAWMQPAFVQSEKQHHAMTRLRKICPGYVWELQNVSVLLASRDGNNERMLLIAEANVTQIWTPEHHKNIDHQKAVQWMERRDAFQSQWDDQNNNADPPPALQNNQDPSSSRDIQRTGSFGHPAQEEEEEEDEELNAYRKRLYATSSSSAKAAPPKDEEEEEMGEVGGPKIRSFGLTQSIAQPPSSTNRRPLTQNHATIVQPPRSAVVSRRPCPPVQEPNKGDQANVDLLEVFGGPSHLSQTRPPIPSQPPASRHPQSTVTQDLAPMAASQRFSQPPPPASQRPRSQASHIPSPPQPSIAETPRAAPPQDSRRNIGTHSVPKANNPYNQTKGSRRRVSLSQLPALPPKPTARGPFLSQSTPSQPQNKENATQPNPPSHNFSRFAPTATAPRPFPKTNTGGESAGGGTSVPAHPMGNSPRKDPAASGTQKRDQQPKKKKEKVQVSPLSKPKDPSKLWADAAAMGAEFLDLSSSEEEEEEEACKTTKSQTTKSQKAAVPKVASKSNTVAKKSGTGITATSSIFQAACAPGIDWMGLSDEED